MQSCLEPPPPHGATPSSPIDCSHSSTHSSVRGSFHTPESVPPPSSPPFFTMNPLTDQRLTGSMMPYHPVDHHHALPRYAHFWCFVDPTHLLILSVLVSRYLLAHLPTKIPFRGSMPRHGMPPCWTQVPLPDTRLRAL